MENFLAQTLLFLVLIYGIALGSVDYCRKHLFHNVKNNNVMHFSKENIEKEYAIIDGFKSLHCCSRGYRSIEWFKDGRPYPWSTDVSTLIISPESGNQTIYSADISKMDSGKYWCIVRNDTDFLRHDVVVKVSGLSILDDPPKLTYGPKDQWIALGQDARFYCEAFVGNVSLPDAKSEISWRRLGVNSSVLNNERIKQHVVFREGNQILGCYLFIRNVEEDDYGQYGCRVSNTGDQFLDLNASLIKEDKTVPKTYESYLFKWKVGFKVLMIISAVVSTFTLAFFKSHFVLIYQRLFEKKKSTRVTQCDVIISYHEDDKDIALNKIVFNLQNSYQYICHSQPMTFDKLSRFSGCKEINEMLSRSKRFIILLSPALVDHEWSCQKLHTVLQNVINVHPRIIIVLLQSLPQSDLRKEVPPLGDLLQHVYCVEYSETETQKFWDKLTLGLPARKSTFDVRENVELV